MLNEIMALMRAGHMWSISDIAEKFNTTESQVKAAIEFLEQAGYIKRTSMTGCSGQCKNCHGCDGLDNLSHQLFAWEIRK